MNRFPYRASWMCSTSASEPNSPSPTSSSGIRSAPTPLPTNPYATPAKPTPSTTSPTSSIASSKKSSLAAWTATAIRSFGSSTTPKSANSSPDSCATRSTSESSKTPDPAPPKPDREDQFPLTMPPRLGAARSAEFNLFFHQNQSFTGNPLFQTSATLEPG